MRLKNGRLFNQKPRRVRLNSERRVQKPPGCIEIAVTRSQPRSERQEFGTNFLRQVLRSFKTGRVPPGGHWPLTVDQVVAEEESDLRISRMLTVRTRNKKLPEALGAEI